MPSAGLRADGGRVDNRRMPGHVYVDENGYLVAAAALLPGDPATARRVMHGLVMPRQHRLHFTRKATRGGNKSSM